MIFGGNVSQSETTFGATPKNQTGIGQSNLNNISKAALESAAPN